jgi:hypothetical protein
MQIWLLGIIHMLSGSFILKFGKAFGKIMASGFWLLGLLGYAL